MADVASTPAIELAHVNRRFLTPNGRSLTALRDFSMTVGRGEFAAIVGPTGCGKSTTLNLVTGLAKPSGGEVRVMGQEVAGIKDRACECEPAQPRFRGHDHDTARISKGTSADRLPCNR